MYYLRIFAAVGVGIALNGCGTEPLICTAQLVGLSVAVINDVRQPLNGLSVTATVQRTGTVLDITSASPPADLAPEGGHVIVFSDHFIEAVRRGGDDVAVVVLAGGHAASGLYRFGSDGCHVQKIAGPDSLVMS
jgi:hypothetical protein